MFTSSHIAILIPQGTNHNVHTYPWITKPFANSCKFHENMNIDFCVAVGEFFASKSWCNTMQMQNPKQSTILSTIFAIDWKS